MVRNKINSQSIQEKFPKYYEKLFSQCAIVVSSSDTLFWSGEYVRFFGGLAIIQKLPTKVFVGLELIPQEKIFFAESLLGYVPYSDKFIEFNMEPAKEKRLLNFLNKYCLTFGSKHKKVGFKIHILAESHCGGGLGTTGVFLTCLAAAILLLYDVIKPKNVELLHQLPLQDQIKDHRSVFNKIFRLGWRLTAISRGGSSSGIAAFGAMLSTNQPIVYLSEGSNCVKNHPTVNSWKDELENCQVFDQISYWGAPLGQIFGFRDPLTWPIDIARIWSGSMVNTEHILKSIDHIQEDLAETRSFILKPLAKNLFFESTKEQPFFYQDAQRIHRDGFWYDYVKMLNLTSIRILESFAGLFREGSSEGTIRDFFEALIANHRTTQYLGTSTLILDSICRFLIKEGFRVNETVGSGAKMEGIGKGGHVLFAFPSGELWDRMETIIKKLQSETKKDIWLDWASWIDGWGYDGLKIEQNIADKNFSTFLSPDSVRISHWRHNQLIKNAIISRQELNNTIKEGIFVLDNIENRIYIKGEPLTSREIPSASGAIAILNSLLKKESLKNNEMPSAYAHSRYDLQSKIIIPLQKVLKKNLGEDLNFTIHGGMYDIYSLTILPNDLEITLAEPLMMK